MNNIWGVDSESTIENLPIIRHPLKKYDLDYCSFCRKKKQTKIVTIRTSDISRDIRAVCEECAVEIAAFLENMWIKDMWEVHGPTLKGIVREIHQLKQMPDNSERKIRLLALKDEVEKYIDE